MVSYFNLEPTNETTNFQKEITLMMHGFGDNPNPNAATVLLVENIVLHQLRSLVQEALAISINRESKLIKNFDIIFIMRRNPYKLKRLHDYQSKLELISQRQEEIGATNNPAELLNLLEDEKDPNLKNKRTHIFVIEQLDETNEVGDIKFDVADYLRKVRAAKITETMSFDKYQAYHKARCSSFRSRFVSVHRNYGKLEVWVNPNKEVKLTVSALEVLCFVAYETVAEIVDAVFLVRQDAKQRPNDPFSKFEGGHFCNPSGLANAVYIKSGYEGVPAITVAEVREVLRRYFAPNSGMNGLFCRNMSLDLPNKYIAF